MTGTSMPATVPLQIEIYRHTFRQQLQRDQESRERQRLQALQAMRDKAPAILTAYPSVRRAYLFGSVTRPGAFRPTSDIDIALEGTTAAEYFAVWRDLERALPGWVMDVREITGTSPFADLIRKTGMLIYERVSSSTPERGSCNS